MRRNVALLGCGGWGKNLARNLNELGALAVIVDPAPQAAVLADSLQVAHVDDMNSTLADPAIAAVVIATPAVTHFDIASAALKAGKHVFVEKPIALSTAEGSQLASLSQETNRILMVGHLLQYHPVFIALKALIAGGELGHVRHIYSSRMSLGVIRSEEDVIWSFSPHDISMVLSILGDTPLRVSAVGSSILRRDIADSGSVHLEFAHGVKADITSSWFHPDKEQKLTVVGEKATAIFSDTAEWDEKLRIFENYVTWIGDKATVVQGAKRYVAVPKGEPLRLEMQHFLDCVTSNKQPRTDAAEATRVLAILQCAEASLNRTNTWVQTREFLPSFVASFTQENQDNLGAPL